MKSEYEQILTNPFADMSDQLGLSSSDGPPHVSDEPTNTRYGQLLLPPSASLKTEFRLGLR